MTIIVLILFTSDSHCLLDFSHGQPQASLLMVGSLQVTQRRGEKCDWLELMVILANINNPQK